MAPLQHLRRKSVVHRAAVHALRPDPDSRNQRAARFLATEKGHSLQNNHDVEMWWRRRGVPGAEWVIGIFVAFAVIVLASWGWEANHSATAASAASPHMSGAHNGASR